MMAENDAVEEGTTEAGKDINTPLTNDRPDEELEVAAIVGAEADENEAPETSAEPKQSDERKKRWASPLLRQIVPWFAACGRCSFFLAGYRLICDEDTLETAVANRGKKWLTVPWSHALAGLIHKTYGSRIDIGCYHFEGQCLECHRRFTYQGAEKEDGPATFRIELRP